jgi:hypothetical protein
MAALRRSARSRRRGLAPLAAQPTHSAPTRPPLQNPLQSPQLPLAFVRRPEFWPAYHPAVAAAAASAAPAPAPANGAAAHAAHGPRRPEAGVDFPENDLVQVQGGEVVLGKPQGYPTFGFDNEYGTKAIQVGG